MDRDAKRATSAGTSTLGRGISIQGRIHGDGDLTVEGTIEGELSIEGELRVEQGAEVRARTSAGSAVIEGLFEGDLASSGAVAAGPGAVVSGTVTAAGFSMSEGAKVSATIACELELPPELAKAGR
jgi:cytoskeletal protein CcmA (bactofilin family)